MTERIEKLTPAYKLPLWCQYLLGKITRLQRKEVKKLREIAGWVVRAEKPVRRAEVYLFHIFTQGCGRLQWCGVEGDLGD